MLFDRRQVLLELLEKCPVRGDNPNTCPFYSMRKWEPDERVEWAQQLPVEELDRLYEHHCGCYSQKTHDSIEEKMEASRKRRMGNIGDW